MNILLKTLIVITGLGMLFCGIALSYTDEMARGVMRGDWAFVVALLAFATLPCMGGIIAIYSALREDE